MKAATNSAVASAEGHAADEPDRVAEADQRQRAAATRGCTARGSAGMRSERAARHAAQREHAAEHDQHAPKMPGTRPGAVYSVAPMRLEAVHRSDADDDREPNTIQPAPPTQVGARRCDRPDPGACAILQGLGMPTVSGDTLALPAACCVHA